MWHFTKSEGRSGALIQFRLHDESGMPVSAMEVFRLWQDNETMRQTLIDELVQAPFVAYRWETPAITLQNQERDFEFVLLQCDMLDRRVDRNAFADHFQPDAEIATFMNLGNDARMIVPCPCTDDSAYGHLAAFVRNAPSQQVHELWKTVGICMAQSVHDKPIWLSTAGMGVSWLHVRMDSRPKYYGHAPYKAESV